MRKLILHYHLFKNAGSSIDSILQHSFGETWLSFDKENPAAKILPAELAAMINDYPHVRAISSHQVMPPLPVGDFEIFPIVFLRHPIARARSAYLFEWKKQLGLSRPKGNFADYVREQLDTGSRGPISNYQVFQLSNIAYDGEKPRHGSSPADKLERAKAFLDELPFFGLVEHFQESLERMHFYFKYHFPELRVVNRQLNVSQDAQQQLQERLLEIRRQLGEALYSELIDRNQQDLELYKYASSQFNSVVPREI